MNFKDKIKDRGLKISWIAKKIGVSQPMLSMYLRGQRSLSDDKERKLKEILR